jgi:hypothetical protein
LCAVKNLEDRVRTQIEIGEAEVAKIGRNEGLENGSPAAVKKKDLVPG